MFCDHQISRTRASKQSTCHQFSQIFSSSLLQKKSRRQAKAKNCYFLLANNRVTIIFAFLNRRLPPILGRDLHSESSRLCKRARSLAYREFPMRKLTAARACSPRFCRKQVALRREALSRRLRAAESFRTRSNDTKSSRRTFKKKSATCERADRQQTAVCTQTNPFETCSFLEISHGRIP